MADRMGDLDAREPQLLRFSPILPTLSVFERHPSGACLIIRVIFRLQPYARVRAAVRAQLCHATDPSTVEWRHTKQYVLNFKFRLTYFSGASASLRRRSDCALNLGNRRVRSLLLHFTTMAKNNYMASRSAM